jgi:hypothetical protein
MTITPSIVLGMRRTVWYRHHSFACWTKAAPPTHARTHKIIIFNTHCFSTVTWLCKHTSVLGYTYIPKLVMRCLFVNMWC